jgi:RNA polymerase sigma-70 factor, ECF subfamily
MQPAQRLTQFETHRHELIALAYRMLGDRARAEDMVQEAWLRWQDLEVEPDSPKAYLVTIVTRLCLNELDSARARREHSRSDRLPEPIDLAASGLARIEQLDQISMAFMVVLQRLTAAERAVLLLHDVFDFGHEEISALVGKNPAACRKLLSRARENLSVGRRLLQASREEHERLLQSFTRATEQGDLQALTALLADEVVLITDAGSEGRSFAGVRNLDQPLHGVARVAAFVVTTTTRTQSMLHSEQRELNGQPALVLWHGDRPFAALLLQIADGKIQQTFFHADPARLGHLGARSAD